MERVAAIIVDEIGLGKEEDFANGSALEGSLFKRG